MTRLRAIALAMMVALIGSSLDVPAASTTASAAYSENSISMVGDSLTYGSLPWQANAYRSAGW
ncbi:MAG TPA: hypothetical protein PLV68_11665, partial [Ilumatobacteraceae bacterium]|nr:hypothetical protein [Ilumatobacteraceae bacterium]